MAVTYVFPGSLTPVLTQLFFPKPPTTFLTCIRGQRRKIAGKKVLSHPGIEPTTSRSRVRYAIYLSTRRAFWEGKKILWEK